MIIELFESNYSMFEHYKHDNANAEYVHMTEKSKIIKKSKKPLLPSIMNITKRNTKRLNNAKMMMLPFSLRCDMRTTMKHHQNLTKKFLIHACTLSTQYFIIKS